MIMDKRDDRLKDFHAGFNKVQKIIESNLVKGGFSGDKASKKALDSTMVLSIQFNIYTQQYLDLWQMNSNIKISRREYVDSLATIIGIQYFTVAFDSLFENNLKKIEAIWKVDK